MLQMRFPQVEVSQILVSNIDSRYETDNNQVEEAGTLVEVWLALAAEVKATLQAWVPF